MSVLNVAQEKLGKWSLVFRNPYHLRQILFHPSVDDCATEFERYEFLGDKVLGMVVATDLVKGTVLASESELSNQHSSWVNKRTLASLGKMLDLDKLIQVRGDLKKETLLADGFEALIGGIYLDQGVVKVAEFWAQVKQKIIPIVASSKTQLQEWAHKRGLVPVYRCERIGGSDHRPVFRAELVVDKFTAVGDGASKKEAENAAVDNFINQGFMSD